MTTRITRTVTDYTRIKAPGCSGFPILTVIERTLLSTESGKETCGPHSSNENDNKWRYSYLFRKYYSSDLICGALIILTKIFHTARCSCVALQTNSSHSVCEYVICRCSASNGEAVLVIRSEACVLEIQANLSSLLLTLPYHEVRSDVRAHVSSKRINHASRAV